MVMILSEEGIYVKDCNEVFRIALVLYEEILEYSGSGCRIVLEFIRSY